MSTDSSYFCENISGAMYTGVPHFERNVLELCVSCDIPKSISLISVVEPSTSRMFSGFRSRCITPCAWRNSSVATSR